MKDLVSLSEEEISALVEKGVYDAFVRVGMDADDPLSLQKDFQHLRDWRRSSESLRRSGRLAVLAFVITGLLGLIWVGLKQSLPP